MYSQDAFEYLKHNNIKADLIFIDGDHNHPIIDYDINHYKELLKVGGIFCGHDAHPAWPHVLEALNMYLPNWKHSGHGSIWYYEN
jgi:hypothetical protein